jgi:trigger factor
MLKTKEQLDPCKVELNIEVETDKVTEALEEAYKHFSKRVAVPGFRKGKAPRAMVERYIDEEDMRDRAARELIPEAYEAALKEADIDPYDMPDLEIVQFEPEQPFVFKATVALPPKVELGEYVNLTVERMAHVVSDEDVDRQIDEVLNRAAKLEPVADRPVQKDDVVNVEMQRVDEEGSKPFTQMVQAGSNLPDFDEQFTGMTVDEERVIELRYPEDAEDKELAGTTMKLRVKVLEIKERKTPALDEEFAKSAGAESVDDLKKMFRTRMEQAANDVADRQVQSQLVWEIVDKSQIHFPESMAQHEAEHRMKSLLERLSEAKIELTDYLAQMEKTFDQLHDEFLADAQRDIKNELVMMEIAHRESIAVTDQDVEAEIERLAEDRKVAVASMQAYVDRTDGRSKMRSELLRKKILDFLVKSSNIKDVAMKGDSE